MMQDRYDENTALIVVDVQNCFCTGGTLAVPRGEEVVPLINTLMPRFAHVVLTQDWHPAGHASFASSHAGKAPFDSTKLPYGNQVLWPDHAVQGTLDADFHPDLNRHAAQIIIRKGMNVGVDSYSAFTEADRTTTTGLAGYLHAKGIERVMVVGLATDFCVAWTALDAVAAGFDTTVIEPACRAIDLNGSLAAAWQQMQAAGVTRV